MAEPVTAGVGNVSRADVVVAQGILDQLVEVLTGREDGSWLTQAALLELRGILAAQLSDVRYSGHVEGKLEGRRQVAGWLRDALAGEGL